MLENKTKKRQLIMAGNAKKNLGTYGEIVDYLGGLDGALSYSGAKVILGLPSFSIMSAKALIEGWRGVKAALACQNISAFDGGADTGEISPEMLKREAGYCLVGHSERRQRYGETNGVCNAKVKALIKTGITPIYCIGETLQQRKAKNLRRVLREQINQGLDGVNLAHQEQVIIAYEPVWAIGTGEVATPEQAQEAHVIVRDLLKTKFGANVGARAQILYGGSMNPGNAQDLLSQPDVDGGLVGGACLTSESFGELIEIANSFDWED